MQVQEISSFLLDKLTGLGTLPDSHTIDNGGIICEVSRGWGVKLANHLHLVPRLRIRGFIPSFPHIFPCSCA